jgi:hypothetical protein
MKDNQSNEQTQASGNDALSDILAACGFLLFAVFMFIGATQFTYKSNMGFITSAGFTPMLLSILVIVLSVILIIETVKRNTSARLSLSEWFKGAREDETVRRSVVLALLTGVYIALVGVVNFILITFVFLFVIYYYLQVGKLWRVLLYSVMNTVLIAYIIPTVYQMPLP